MVLKRSQNAALSELGSSDCVPAAVTSGFSRRRVSSRLVRLRNQQSRNRKVSNPSAVVGLCRMSPG